MKIKNKLTLSSMVREVSGFEAQRVAGRDGMYLPRGYVSRDTWTCHRNSNLLRGTGDQIG